MEQWDDPVARFRWRLESEACTRLLDDKVRLASLRYDWKEVRWLAKFFERVLQHRNVVLEEEVFKASVAPDPKTWDEEDEQKSESARRLYAFRGVPNSTKEWTELDAHREDCRRVKDTILPPDLTQLIMDFRGPNPIVETVDPEACLVDQADPWTLPLV